MKYTHAFLPSFFLSFLSFIQDIDRNMFLKGDYPMPSICTHFRRTYCSFVALLSSSAGKCCCCPVSFSSNGTLFFFHFIRSLDHVSRLIELIGSRCLLYLTIRRLLIAQCILIFLIRWVIMRSRMSNPAACEEDLIYHVYQHSSCGTSAFAEV